MGVLRLEDMAAQIRNLGKLVKVSAQEINTAMVADIKSKVDAGTDQDGKAWPKTKEGNAALKNAGTHLKGTVTSVGSRVVSVVEVTSRHHILHDLGRANGAPRRQLLPDAITPSLLAKITAVLTDNFEELTRG